jgi:hypothetical protein
VQFNTYVPPKKQKKVATPVVPESLAFGEGQESWRPGVPSVAAVFVIMMTDNNYNSG